MADVTSIKDASGSTVPIITDEVTDGTFGTGQVQYVKIMDGTVNGTNKAAATTANGLAVDVTRVQGTVSVTGSQGAAQQTAWTSVTTLNTANSIAMTGYNTVSVAMSNTSTMTGGVLTFEVSPDGGTTWFTIAMSRIDSYTVETTYTLNTVANRAWSTSVDGFTNFRVRLSTVITGTGTATINVIPQTFAIEPIVSVGQATAANLNANVSGPGIPTALGSSTSANSMRVVIASDQVAIPIKGNILDNAGFTDGTTPVDPAGFIFDEVAGTALTENDVGAARMDSKRAVVHVLEDATTRGQRAAISAAGRLSVDASGVAVPITDNSGSLTVDAPVGTPVFARLSDGTTALTTTSGRLSVDGSGVTQPVSAASLPLPSGAAQDSTLTGGTVRTKITDGTNNAAVKAASTAAVATDPAVVIAVSPNNTVAVTGTFWQTTQPVSGTFWQSTQPVSIASMPSTPVTGTFWQATQPVSGTFWQATQPVSIAATVATSEVKPATGTTTSTAASATNVTVLASNASRKGATVFNDSTALCYLKLGATASATSHTVQLLAGAYYEVPFGYTGIIDGIWVSATGSARVTEIT